MKRFAIPSLILIATAGAALLAYQRYASPTRVALVNFADFTASRTIKAVVDLPQFRFQRVGLDDLERADNFDFVMIFGRGLALDTEQLAHIAEAVESGSEVFVDSPTNPNHVQLTSLDDAVHERVRHYVDNGGDYNYRNLWYFVRRELDSKLWQSPAADDPLHIDTDVLFYLGDEVFTTVDDYQRFYETVPTYNPDGYKIALITTVPGPFNANRDHLNAMIDGFEAAGMRIYPINGRAGRLSLVAEVDPDAVVMMPHGRFGFGQEEEVINWFSERQIPLLTPLSIFDEYESWLEDPQGYSGGTLTMNVVLPELDGGVVPRVVNAQFLDRRGFRIFEAVPERLNEYVDMVGKWIELKRTPNDEKRIGIVYFRGPGKNALVAGGMEVTPSLFNTLHLLKEQGYDLGDLPDDYGAFRSHLESAGPVLTPDGLGQVQRYLTQGDPAWVEDAEYLRWCREHLAEGVCARIDERHGTDLGNFMVDQLPGGEKRIAVTNVRFGNVVLMPQPLAGFGEDSFRMVHGTEEAPPHTYAAAYLWLRLAFGADAIIHYGTHGSLEFTQGKQVALSPNDWADALIGSTPHFYIYTMSNVGEAIIAKRRSYATIINHLTPPFQRAGLYSELATLNRWIDGYRLTEGQVKAEQRRQIIELATEMELDADLDMNLAESDTWDDDVLPGLEMYLGELSEARINKGLYTWGKEYLEEDAALTAELMLIDSVDALIPESVRQIAGAESLFADLNSGTSVDRLVGSLKFDPEPELRETLSQYDHYRSMLLAGGDDQKLALESAVAGGYVAPASGGDPLLNPDALPTGRNMFSIDAEQTPSQAAWEVGKALADDMLEDYRSRHGRLPNKVSFTLWPSSFIHSHGATVAQILYLLGVEPVYAPNGQVHILQLIPAADLGRPRIDVVVQSAGQLRDLAASRLALINRAVEMAAAATDREDNFVRDGVRLAEQHLLDSGLTPSQARRLSTRRSFGGINGSYGTQIMGMVEQGDTWQSDAEVADQYIYNMGAIYGDSEEWGEYVPDLFTAALLNTDVVIQPRSSNTWGGLSLDHVYEFMGGLSLAVRAVTGKDAEAYFSDYRNPNRARMETLQAAIAKESRTTLFNPRYLEGLTAGEASSAEVLAETLRNSFGWNTMKPAALAPGFWNQVYETLIEDKHELALQAFFETENPYALQEMTGVMLEAARKDFWTPDTGQLQVLAELHADLVSRFEAGCGSFTCGNQSLQDFIASQLNETLLGSYRNEITAAEIGEVEPRTELVLREQNTQQETEEAAADREDRPSASDSPDSAVDTGRNLAAILFGIGLAVALVSLVAYRRQRGPVTPER
ncbi:MAG: cobaltochelatase subunit CobN [Rhodospirillaceae bacterium]|nr:cobaltochelatase subunit CobN [Rhodospirillaceae bacterium]MDD9996452.1 cobaltochelatase subunit CobN [Rhodospirillaceae bacterium]MDE0362145.1 cobaltochelatase subunit CobN [Rhodospirillaceae bacterium]